MKRVGTGLSTARLIVNPRCFTYQSPISPGLATWKATCSIRIDDLLVASAGGTVAYGSPKITRFSGLPDSNTCFKLSYNGYGFNPYRVGKPQDPPAPAGGRRQRLRRAGV